MSLLKNWKLLLASSAVFFFAACAGSSGGSSGGSSASGGRAPAEEKVDENQLKKTEQEAMAITEENHKLRREIFESKNKLGIPNEPQSGE
ncbi:MAG: hypothetical protein LBR60_04090 [Fibrobacter sp.]|jgi:hypothetical protein|nr:hypothetical protein [Fibrobacter sp.]